MVISKLFKVIVISVLILLVPISCINNRQDETQLITISYGDDELDNTYLLVKGDCVSSFLFMFKYYDGAYDMNIYPLDPDYFQFTINKLKDKINKQKDKTFTYRKGHVSNELTAELSKFLSITKGKICLDSIRCITFLDRDVFDIGVEMSEYEAVDSGKCDDYHKYVEKLVAKTELKDKMNFVLKPYNFEVSSILLDLDGKILGQDTKSMNAKNYGYTGPMPKRFLHMPLRVIIKKHKSIVHAKPSR